MKDQGDIPGGAVSVFINFQYVGARVGLSFFRIGGSVEQAHKVGVLLNAARFSEVVQFGFPLVLFTIAVELRQTQHGKSKLLKIMRRRGN